VIKQNSEFLAGAIEDILQAHLKDHGKEVAEEMNKGALGNRLNNEESIKALGEVIQKLSQQKTAGVTALYQYLHAALTPALLKTLMNVVKATPQTFKAESGHHKMEAMPMNIMAHLFGIMQKEITAIAAQQPFIQARKDVLQKEDEIEKKKNDLAKAKQAAQKQQASPPVAQQAIQPVDQLEAELKVLEAELKPLKTAMAAFFQPLSSKMLEMAAGNAADVSNPDHPFHDFKVLPEKTRNEIWNKIRNDCLNQVIASHYHSMNPQTEPLEKELRAITGNNKLIEFCRMISIVTRDGTHFAFDTKSKKIAGDLSSVMTKFLAQIPSNAPKYMHDIAKSAKKHQETYLNLITSFFKSVGTAKLDSMNIALQKLSYPALLKVMTKLANKLKDNDNEKTRTELVMGMLKIISQNGKMPHKLMSDVKNNPEQEGALKKAHYSKFMKEFLDKIGFTKDDLPLDDAEKDAFYSLIMTELTPLLMDLALSALAPGGLLEPIDDSVLNSIEIASFEAILESKEQIKKLKKPARVQDAQQDALDKAIGEAAKNYLQDRFPNESSIQAAPLIVKRLLSARAQDVGAFLREYWCSKGSLVGTISWLSTKLTKALFPNSHYDEKQDKIVTKEKDPTFVQPNPTPAELKQRAEKARSLGAQTAKQLGAEGIDAWFENIINSIAEAINNGLKKLYDYIDKKTNTTHRTQAFRDGLKTAVRYIAWGLFYITVLPWLISLLVKYVFVPLTARRNLDNLHKNFVRQENRNIILNAVDMFIGRPLPVPQPG